MLNTDRRSYHDPQAHFQEEINGAINPLWNSSRGSKRYDPYTRKYRKWFTPQDWAGDGVHGQGIGPNGYGYPRFTRSEGRKMLRRYAQGHRVDPARMGKEWTWDGPKVGTFLSRRPPANTACRDIDKSMTGSGERAISMPIFFVKGSTQMVMPIQISGCIKNGRMTWTSGFKTSSSQSDECDVGTDCQLFHLGCL